MKDLLAYIGFLLLILILQVSFFSRLPAADYGPDLLLVLVFSAGFLQGSKRGSLIGFIAGMLQDVLLGGAFGIYTVSRVIVGAFAGQLKNNIYPGKLPLVGAVIFGFTLGHEVLIFLLSEEVILRITPFNAFKQNFVPTAVYTMLIGTVIYTVIYYFISDRGVEYEEED